MKHNSRIGAVLVSAIAIVLASLPSPAFAQLGSLTGKVVDEAGKPVPDVELTLNFMGDHKYTAKVKTNAKGEWSRGGLDTGNYAVAAVKGDLGGVTKVTVVRDKLTYVPDLVLKKGGAAVAKDATNLSAEDADRRSKKAAELQAAFKEAGALMEAGNFDGAIEKLNIIVKEIPKCGACYLRIGDAYWKKKDEANAEANFLKAIEAEPDQPDSYAALATLYNQQRKFDEAAKMGAKANELASAGAGAAGGGGAGNATSLYNQGVILWNQSKAAEAQGYFEKAIQADPNMAEAHYLLGMTFISQGKMSDAKKPLEQYLKLAPTGPNAETAKALLAQIK